MYCMYVPKHDIFVSVLGHWNLLWLLDSDDSALHTVKIQELAHARCIVKWQNNNPKKRKKSCRTLENLLLILHQWISEPLSPTSLCYAPTSKVSVLFCVGINGGPLPLMTSCKKNGWESIHLFPTTTTTTSPKLRVTAMLAGTAPKCCWFVGFRNPTCDLGVREHCSLLVCRFSESLKIVAVR